MILSNAAIRNRTTVWVLVVLIIITGLYSYITLPRESAPDIPLPIVSVTTAYEGVSPRDMENFVTQEIEQELSSLKGLKEIRSTSAEGLSLIIIEFQPDIVIEDALQYVRDRVDIAKAELPENAEEPVIQELNIAEFPIMLIAISGEVSPVRLKRIADDMEDELEMIPGVMGVDVLGALEREIRLEMDHDRIVAYGLSMPELMKLIPGQNVNISAGGLETEGIRFNVRVPAEFVDPGEVDELVLATRDGKPVYLTDVGRVRDTFKDRTSYARLNGTETITVSVKKRIGANIIDISDQVNAALDEARRLAPKGVVFETTFDQSRDIRNMVSDLENNIFSGLVLVVAVLVLFMGWRTSMIVAFAIPMSMLITFSLILALGYTLNMIVLFSLILALGMLVDNAIVIVENIYRYVHMGYDRIEAAKKGTAEVAWPVATSTATTIAAFGPLLFWPGMMGDFMKYVPITLIMTLSSSLFVALVISPTVCSFFVSKKVRPRDGESWFVRGYKSLLAAALEHRFTTLSLAVMLLIALVMLYAKRGHGVELFPQLDPRQAVINIRSPQGTNIRESDRLARLAEERVMPYAEHLDYLVTNVGSGDSSMVAFGAGMGGPHEANLTLVFRDYELRETPSARVLEQVRSAVSDIAGAEIKVEQQDEGPPVGDAVTVRISGEDFGLLGAMGEQVRQKIATVPGLVNLRSDLESTRPELVFTVDRRRAALLNANASLIGEYLKTAIFGTEVGTYRQFNEEYDITIRLPLSQRINIEDLFRLQVPDANGNAVPLTSLGRFEYRGGFGTINRVNQKRTVTITGAAEGRLDEEVLGDVKERLKDFKLPGYNIVFAGKNEDTEESQAFLSKAFVIALLLIALILVAQFNTISAPFIIMTTVVLSLVGVFSGLLICQMPFGIIMTGIGVISLAGVVVNNAIVLLDYTRQLQNRGMELIEATIQAGATRLRPVLLTATTTILGLIPMALGISYDIHKLAWATRSESSQWWRSMAIAVIFGLAFATVLTLVVVPSLYVSLYRLAARFGKGGLHLEERDSWTDGESV